MQKIYTVTKYVAANSIAEAIRKEKKTPPIEIWLTEHSKNQHLDEVSPSKKR